MGFPESEIVAAIYRLLPGFIAAWVFYGLTAHPPKSPFERTIQALIFTTFTQAVVIPLGAILVGIGRWRIVLGTWNENTAFVLSVIVAVILGLVFCVFANTSKLHERLPKWVTKRTSYPSEWYSAFNRDERYVYLHLTGGRRLYGWPTEWPDHPDRGHFVIQEPEWLLSDNQRAPLLLTHKMIVPVTEVEMVEFEKWPAERNYEQTKFKVAEDLLVSLQNQDSETNEPTRSDDGSLRQGRRAVSAFIEQPASENGDEGGSGDE